MQKILLAAIFLLAASILPAQNPSTASVFFETDRYELSPDARQTLDALAQQLAAAPDYSVNIEAWTDDRGTQAYNLRLAENRASAVRQYLAEKGLLLTKTSVRSWGEQNLDYDNATEENRQLNRRVDVALTPVFFHEYSALQTRLVSNTEQTLTIQPAQPQTVTAANGTKVVVPAQAFVFEDGTSPEGPVELIVREAFSPSDFITHNLTTTSNGRILQTGGMVYIGAQANGRPLTLADGASLTVALPTQNVDPNMELFYAEQTADGNVNWQPAGQKFRQTLENPRVTLDIDPALGARIMAIQVPVYPAPVAPVFSSEMPPEPRQPIAPYKPRAPQKPDWAQVQKMFGGEKMSKKEAKKADKHFQTLLAKYQRDSADYVRLINRYFQNHANYEAAKVKYASERQHWRDELGRRIAAIRNYERELYLHEYSVALQLAVKRVGKNIQRYENYSNLDFAVHSAATEHYRLMQKERVFKPQRDLVSVGALYNKYVGYKVMESSGFKDLLSNRRNRSNHTEFSDNREAIRKMHAETGIRPISDSLRREINERQMLVARTPGQADRAIRAYVADVTQLGWINCDRFYDDPAEKVQLVVNEQEDATMYALCRDLNSILPLTRTGENTYAVNGLPKGRAVSIVSIKLKEGVPYLALHDTKVGQTKDLKMAYRSMTLQGLKEELKRLNI
jgi:hypothetical protein